MNIFKGLVSKIKGIASKIITKITPKSAPKEPTPEPEWEPEDPLANEKIKELIDKIKEMDSEGYAPEFTHTWSMSPEKSPNSNGAGIAKETSGNKIIDLIRDEVNVNGATAVAKSLEAHWDEIIYMIERLEFAIYDAQYRKKAGGRGAYEAGLLRLRQILTSEVA